MKCKTVIGDAHDEQVLIFARERTPLVRQIEQLVQDDAFELVGFCGGQAVKLNLSEVYCFTVSQNKIYALTSDERLQLKCRLYQLEQRLPESFVKINQSCIANIRLIKRFEASIGGALMVKFKNGYSDYVSRRNLKNVKERFGIK